MQKKFFIANLVMLAIIVILIECVSYMIIKGRLGDFDLETQGGTTMIRSYYQVWEHPANYKSWSGKTEFNNLGLRRRSDLTVEKPDNVTRIVLMGGSAAFGSQAMPGSMYLTLSGQGEYSNEETISYYLEQLLNEKYPHRQFQVINAATNWSRLHQQMLHYLRKIRVMSPDLVLSMDAYNDSSFISQNNTYADTQTIGETDLFGNLKHKLSPIFQKSYTAYLLAMVIFRTGESPEPDQQAIKKYAKATAPENLDSQLAQAQVDYALQHQINLSEYMNAMKHFDSILDNDRIPHVFYLQPLAILDEYKQLTDIERAIRGYQFDTLKDSQLLRINFFNSVSRHAQELENQGILDFESMLSVFTGVKENVYSDYCHFTPFGNRLIAEYFLNEIETKFPQLLQSNQGQAFGSL